MALREIKGNWGVLWKRPRPSVGRADRNKAALGSRPLANLSLMVTWGK